jgi:membrane dipeptidase
VTASPLIVDAHNDLLLELVLRHEEENAFAKHWLPQLERGGIGVQVCPLYAAGADDPFAKVLEQAREFDRAVEDNADRVVHVRTEADLGVALASGRIGLILSFEGVEALGDDPAALDDWWDRGVRMASLTWNYPNAFAGGLDTPEQGLSARGEELVDRMIERGVVIDLVHSSPATFDDVVSRADEARLVVTHACCRAVYDHPRNLSDEQLAPIAAHGGVLGMMALTLTVGRDEPTFERFLDHVDHAVDAMGIEHVGLGADFIDQVIAAELAAGVELEPATQQAMEIGGGFLAIPGLRGPSDYAALVEALDERGYTGDRLEAILSGNWLRVLREALP